MNSLLLIPDISGFTRFVNSTAVEHSRHIISELLEIIIDSDILGLTVSEIEGDAVMMYRQEDVPTVSELVNQAEEMFLRFHSHLKLYERNRICECGACMSASGLTLKIVAHSDELEFLKVKEFLKPYGSGMILAHRLLKNEIEGSEYLLISQSILENESNKEGKLPSWASFTRGESSYDDIGTVGYEFVTMGELHKHVPDPTTLPQFERIENPVIIEAEVPASADEVYDLVSNFETRKEWSPDITSIDYEKDRVTRAGTKHECVVNGETLLFETIKADYGDGSLVYGEQLENPKLIDGIATFFIITPKDSGSSVRIEAHYHATSLLSKLLQPLFRSKLKKQLGKIAEKIRGHFTT